MVKKTFHFVCAAQTHQDRTLISEMDVYFQNGQELSCYLLKQTGDKVIYRMIDILGFPVIHTKKKIMRKVLFSEKKNQLPPTFDQYYKVRDITHKVAALAVP